MNAQDLKNSILQLAIQGKLVEQREEEGTGKELLERIAAEKKQLIKEGKLRKQKPLPSIKADEIPYDIPESWEWIRLGDLINISSGKGLTSKQMEEGEIPVFGGNGITGYHNIGNVEKETVVIGRVGYYCGSVHITPTNAWVTDNAFITTYPETQIDRNYLVYILRHLNLGRDNNATAQPVVSGKKIYPILFPLPPLEEQQRIVEKIEVLMPFVEKYANAYSEVEELNKKFWGDMQKSILQYAIKGKLVEQREEEGNAEELYEQIQEEKKKLAKEGKIKKTKAFPDITEYDIPFDIPESWKWVRLGDITHNWGQKKPDKTFDYIDVGSIDNINGLLSEEENILEPKDAPSRARKIVKEGTVLYSTVRPYLLNICIIDKEFKHEPIASTAFAILHPIEGLHNKYLYFILKSPMFVSYVNSVMIGVAYPAINDTNLLAGLIPLPPLNEQKRIVEKIEELLPYAKQLIR